MGESFFIRITPQGRIDKINGLSAVIGNAKSKIPYIPERDLFIKMVEQYFKEASLKRDLEMMFNVFPDSDAKPLKVGDIWTRKELINNDKALLDRTWRFSELRGGDSNAIAVIDVNTLILPAATDTAGPQKTRKQLTDEPEVTIGGLAARSEVKGRGIGRIEIEQPTGRIINSSTTQDLVEKTIILPEGPIRRHPNPPAPTNIHIETTFRMVKRYSEETSFTQDSNRP
jgi:hypothetical protein